MVSAHSPTSMVFKRNSFYLVNNSVPTAHTESSSIWKCENFFFPGGGGGGDGGVGDWRVLGVKFG